MYQFHFLHVLRSSFVTLALDKLPAEFRFSPKRRQFKSVRSIDLETPEWMRELVNIETKPDVVDNNFCCTVSTVIMYY